MASPQFVKCWMLAFNIGLGVDGSASNDSGHMLNEARQAMLLQRVMKTGDALTARQSLALQHAAGPRY